MNSDEPENTDKEFNDFLIFRKREIVTEQIKAHWKSIREKLHSGKTDQQYSQGPSEENIQEEDRRSD